MHGEKRLGQRPSAQDLDRRVAEFQARVTVLNGFTALGTPVTEVAGQVCPGNGALLRNSRLRRDFPFPR
jgi:hypothetical protein